MNIYQKDDRRRLRKSVNEFETDLELQLNTLICGAEIRELGTNDDIETWGCFGVHFSTDRQSKGTKLSRRADPFWIEGSGGVR